MKKKRPKTPLEKAKENAWRLCSIFVRLRDANDSGYSSCYTCGAWKPWREQQAGHFLSGRMNSILFDTRGIRSQCEHCNRWSNGKPIEYMIALEQELGKRKATKLRDELVYNSKQHKSMTLEDYENLIIDFTLKINDLLVEKGLYL